MTRLMITPYTMLVIHGVIIMTSRAPVVRIMLLRMMLLRSMLLRMVMQV